jgi:hypothetical protein
VGDQLSFQLAPITKRVYQPRGINALQLLFKEHFQSLADQYEAKHAIIYGRFRIKRITEVVKKFIQVVLFVPVPETDPLVLGVHEPAALAGTASPAVRLHLPKLLRPYLRHNRRLFSEISRLIFAILQRFYDKAAKRPVRTGMVLAYQTSGEFLRWNPHYHCIVLEGGFDDRGKFVHIPLGDIQKMSEYFRRVVIRFFLKKELINAHLATSLINWKHSGFSVDHSIRIPAFSIRAREALSQYIARPQENGVGTVISFSSQSEFFKGKSETFPVMRFFLELMHHIPPIGCQYIRRYGLYASRTKGKWPGKPYVVRLAPPGWKKERLQASQDGQPYDAEAAYCVSDKESRSTWARLIAQVYEVNPLVCPRCSAPMRILAVITEPQEVRKILRHLVKIGRSPPGFDPASLNP